MRAPIPSRRWMTPADVLTTKEVTHRLAISPRQLQWWDERGLLRPQQVNHQRRYSPHNVVLLAIIVDLKERGLSLQQIRKVLRAHRAEVESSVRSVVEFKAKVIIMASRTRFVTTENAESAIAFLAETREWLAVLSIGPELLAASYRRPAGRPRRCRS